jgi:DNA modification methylase
MTPYYQDDAVTIYHGDAREILPDLDIIGTQAWLTDPPYSSGGFQEAGRAAGSIGKMGALTSADTIGGDTLSTRGYMNLMRDVLRHSRNAAEIGVFTDWRMWINTSDALEYAGLTMRAMIVWSKGNNGIGRPWRNQHELIAFAMRNRSNKERVAKHGNVIDCARSGNEYHPTEKPLELLTKIVDNMVGDVVVDPFAGSGGVLRAAKTLGRQAVGIDIEERYCDIAARLCSQGVLFGVGS